MQLDASQQGVFLPFPGHQGIMKRRNSLLLYLILNIIVSALATLAVLVIWDRTHGGSIFAPGSGGSPLVNPGSGAGANPTAAASPQPTETNPPPDVPVIQIVSVVAAGDLEQEVVLLKRLGEGNLHMAGWKLQGESNTYSFPEQPDLVLYKDGAVQVFSRLGTDSATEMYWNRSDAAWRSGETIRLIDRDGAERASYQVP